MTIDWFQSQWQRVWWTWTPADPSVFSQVYHWFNLLEGCAWAIFAVLVLSRFQQHRQSLWEVPYSLTFLSFGLTDFCEAWEQSTWLIVVKGIHVIALFRLRQVIMTHHYPTATLY